MDASVTLSSPLMHIEGFLEAITTADRNGRIVINKKGPFTPRDFSQLARLRLICIVHILVFCILSHLVHYFAYYIILFCIFECIVNVLTSFIFTHHEFSHICSFSRDELIYAVPMCPTVNNLLKNLSMLTDTSLTCWSLRYAGQRLIDLLVPEVRWPHGPSPLQRYAGPSWSFPVADLVVLPRCRPRGPPPLQTSWSFPVADLVVLPRCRPRGPSPLQTSSASRA